jgi:hypothetical protein
MKLTPKPEINIGFLELNLASLNKEWAEQMRLMKAMFDVNPMGIYCYDMLPTLQRMQLLYCQIAAHTEVIRLAKGEI